MAKHKTLAFFIPHKGCPHRCSFCDQHTISGKAKAPTPEEVAVCCQEMLERHGTLTDTQIAFFGGSFTAIPTAEQVRFLEAVQPFLGKGKFDGIRISTRPDAIDDTVLSRLKAYHVEAIELGAQSMSDRVLAANERGHGAQSVRDASAKIRSAGISLGLQQMVGLYGSSLAEEYDTLNQLLQCQPDTLRIYPTVVLEGTALADRCKDGSYPNLTQEEVLDYCADALCACHSAGVRVIRLGLHEEAGMRERMVAGYYHPAYKELVLSRLYLRTLQRAGAEQADNQLVVETSRGSLSQLLGQRGANRLALAAQGISLVVKESPTLCSGKIQVGEKRYHIYS